MVSHRQTRSTHFVFLMRIFFSLPSFSLHQEHIRDRVNSLASLFPSRDDTRHEEGPYYSPYQLDINESLYTGQTEFPGHVLAAPPLPQESAPIELNYFYGHDMASFGARETDFLLSTSNPDTAASCIIEPSSRIEVRPDMECLVSPMPLNGAAPIHGPTSNCHWNSLLPYTHPQEPCAQLLPPWGPSIQQNDAPPHLTQFTSSLMASTTPTGSHSLVTNMIPESYALCNTWGSSPGRGVHLNALYKSMGFFPPISSEGGYTCLSDTYHSQTDVRSSYATSQLLQLTQLTQSVMGNKVKARPRRWRRASRSSGITSPGSSVMPQAPTSTAASAENPIRRSGRHGPLSPESNANAQHNRMGCLTCYNCKARKVTVSQESSELSTYAHKHIQKTSD